MNPDTLSLCETLGERKALLERFGGLPETTVQNTEWLYMLEQDTRHSLAIEGYFASEEELEAVLQGKRSNLEVTNYFRTAQTVYDQALQYYRDKDLRLDLSLVRHIHSELFRGKNDQRGQFRRGSIQIPHADVKPPEFDIESYLRTALEVMKEDLNAMPILPALARAHTLFESIHPFSDGNGRTGRILLNYLAISQGYPPIDIKGISSSEREQYYAALEAADTGFHKGFPEAARIQAKAGLSVAPGTTFLYSGTGVILLGALVRGVSGDCWRPQAAASGGRCTAINRSLVRWHITTTESVDYNSFGTAGAVTRAT